MFSVNIKFVKKRDDLQKLEQIDVYCKCFPTSVVANYVYILSLYILHVYIIVKVEICVQAEKPDFFLLFA